MDDEVYRGEGQPPLHVFYEANPGQNGSRSARRVVFPRASCGHRSAPAARRIALQQQKPERLVLFPIARSAFLPNARRLMPSSSPPDGGHRAGGLAGLGEVDGVACGLGINGVGRGAILSREERVSCCARSGRV